MAKCPACRSDRVYKGYRPAPILLRMVRIHEFLCENCNLQFRGFSILPPRSRSRKGKTRKRTDESNARITETTPIQIAEPAPLSQPQINSQPNPLRAQSATATGPSMNPPTPVRPMSAQSEPIQATVKRQWEMPAQALEELESKRRNHRSHQTCPNCGATDTERRRRKMWEKVAFAFTSIRAYKCRICGEGFYARRKQQGTE